MKLFHQLEEKDQHNSIHYCLHVIVDDFLTGDINLEASSEEESKIHEKLLKTVEEAKSLPEEDRFSYILDSEQSPLIFEMALDMARSAYYHPDEDMVIHYETLREEIANAAAEEAEEVLIEDINTLPKRGKHSLN